MTPPILNHDQQAAADGFFHFLFNEGKELIISGPGGVGKTFLMSYLIDEIMPRYQKTCRLMNIPAVYDSVVMTATTNKAAEVLAQMSGRPTYTIHSFLNLGVKDNYATGKTTLTKKQNYTIQNNLIIFIDEASMIDHGLMTMIQESTHNCKIVYVGDHCQLSPIMEPLSPIYRRSLPFFELKEQMRNNGQPALMAVCQQLRDTVETGVFHPIKIVPGVIDHLDDAQMEAEVYAHFLHETDSRILAYTNQQVVAYNDHIRDIRQLHTPYTLGERMINNNAVQFSSGMLSVEQEVFIEKLGSTTVIDLDDGIELEVCEADLRTKYGEVFTNVALPVDKEHYTSLIKWFQKQKNWRMYFMLKNKFPDLRPRDAATVHKAQGSTHEVAFIDLDNLSTCRNPNQAARLLYVAFSRAKTRVVLYGKLADKYGGLIY